MADAVRIGPLAGSTTPGDTTQAGHARRWAHPHGTTSFHHVLARALNGSVMPKAEATAKGQTGSWHSAIQRAVMRVPAPVTTQPASVIPAASDAALSRAMALEGVPSSWQAGLRFIMAQESGGRVDVRNPVHSARGLFQLTAANYHFNPDGSASFGDAVQEAQGGIRYIRQRYGSADNAVTFWQQHHWY